ncbi:hypothetical protein [Georgenia sp. SUBG003]|uniref:hypothetical protein n=1 Tax=Georgenia sp. SUBG003 TaxID=1497974 RepID=UPI0004D8C30C|nr:hypothetical protein DA06_06885 [Georgenia sp. SUBG003]
MRQTTAVLLAATLLAVTASCARNTNPDEPTVHDATAACVDHLRRATGQDATVEATSGRGDHAWTVTGQAGDRTFTCEVTYTLSGGGVRTDLYYETDPPLDEPADTAQREEDDKRQHIGDVDGASVYAAQGTPDQPRCIVIVLDRPGVNDTSEAASCTTDEDFAQRGVTVRLDPGDGGRVTATLLPDGFTGQLEDGFAIIGPNLAAPSDAG